MSKSNLRLLIVDDEKTIRNFLKTALSSYGYNVFEAVNGKDALIKARQTRPDIIILDLGLPDIDGIEVISRIRRQFKTPIIILSIRDNAAEKTIALNLGADDYLTKPFSIEELLARLQAVLRRLLPLNKTRVFETGALSVNITNRRVTVHNKSVYLSPIEYDILKLFIINAGKVLTHENILKQIWGKNSKNREGILHLLRVTISNLRAKIEPDPNRPAYIITEPGIGYRLHCQEKGDIVKY
ncbi:MAG: response regulator transcription factor [Candidatus Omnitrophota bacterium]